MSKTVFLWWAHKELWNIVADNPGIDKVEAFRILQEKYPNVEALKIRPKASCFACQSAYDYCIRNGCVLPCKYCPLDWGRECCVDEGTVFNDWCNVMHMTGHTLFVQTCAERIADLPLKKNARELYDVKESPNEE